MNGMASSRSPRPSPLTAPTTRLTIGNSPRLCPRRRNTSPTSASSLCPLGNAPHPVCAVYQRNAECHPRTKATARSSLDCSAITQGSLDLAHRTIIGSQGSKRYSREVDVGRRRRRRDMESALRAQWQAVAAGRLAILADPGHTGRQPRVVKAER